MAYEQSCYDLSLAGYLKDEQRSTLDNMYEDAVEGEVSEAEELPGLSKGILNEH